MNAGPGLAGSLIPPHEYHTIRNPSSDSISVTCTSIAVRMTECWSSARPNRAGTNATSASFARRDALIDDTLSSNSAPPARAVPVRHHISRCGGIGRRDGLKSVSATECGFGIAATALSSLPCAHDGIGGPWRGCVAGHARQGSSRASAGRGRHRQSRRLAVSHRPHHGALDFLRERSRNTVVPLRKMSKRHLCLRRTSSRSAFRRSCGCLNFSAARGDPQGCSGSFGRWRSPASPSALRPPPSRRCSAAELRCGDSRRRPKPSHPAATHVRCGPAQDQRLCPSVSERRFRRNPLGAMLADE